jgi:choline dehydrogenase
MDGTFDVVIVGAGSAGCVLAHGLSQVRGLRVLVLEAGGSDRRLFVQMPLGYGKLFYDPSVNWCYRTEPDEGLAGQSDYWPRGKVLGGSSSINAMVWIRGHPEDYDDWAAVAGPGWGRDAAEAGFETLEAALDIAPPGPHAHPLVGAYLAAGQEAGLPVSGDFNDWHAPRVQEGVGTYRFSIRGARRNSAARAFLRPAQRQGQVAVVTGAHVTEVLFEGKRATGVSYRRGGALHRAMLRPGGEVVLAGGAINTPQLLMLSGIGPGAALAGMGLEVRADLPAVGANLNDHQGINYTWRMRVPTLNDVLRPWWGKVRAGMDWMLRGQGPLARSINHGGGFFRTDPALSRPNMQLYFQAFSTLIPRDGERPVLSPDPFSGLSIGLSNCRPESRGRIELASPDPFAAPRIHARAFATERDVAEMLAAVKMLRKIAAQPAFAALAEEELRPGPQVHEDAALIADFRARSGTVFHPSCTARIGRDPSEGALDPGLRVYGVDGVRVCDASAFPTLIGGNTNAPAMLMGLLLGRRMAAERK